MPSTDISKINLQELAKSGECKTFSLTDSFFQRIDQEEILGGNIHVTLKVRKAVDNLFETNVRIKGDVVVLCDRCLEKLLLPVDLEENIRIYGGNEENLIDDDVRLIEGNGFEYDFSWDIYELTELSLPLQRTHEKKQCNPDMMNRLANQDILD